ncbi:MAG TPA: response regulator, partial [Streptosporangiaceae bacterium]|nr:response regulator [Streptosporangiaceae bacterium]
MNRGPGSTGPAASPGRILIIEDDPEAALFAMHVLGKRGHFDVTHTPDPAVAIDLAAAEHWDLVLTDMELPGMTFAVLLDELRRVARGVPVVVLSAHVEVAELGQRAE